MISPISSFEIISAVLRSANSERHPEPRIFLWIPASAANADAVNPNGIKTLLANGLNIFFINGNSVISTGPRILPRNPPDCTILEKRVFGLSYSKL